MSSSQELTEGRPLGKGVTGTVYAASAKFHDHMMAYLSTFDKSDPRRNESEFAVKVINEHEIRERTLYAIRDRLARGIREDKMDISIDSRFEDLLSELDVYHRLGDTSSPHVVHLLHWSAKFVRGNTTIYVNSSHTKLTADKFPRDEIDYILSNASVPFQDNPGESITIRFLKHMYRKTRLADASSRDDPVLRKLKDTYRPMTWVWVETYMTFPMYHGSLLMLLESKVLLFEEEKLDICKQMIMALMVLHKEQITHRDFHWANILYRENDKRQRSFAVHDFDRAAYSSDKQDFRCGRAMDLEFLGINMIRIFTTLKPDYEEKSPIDKRELLNAVVKQVDRSTYKLINACFYPPSEAPLKKIMMNLDEMIGGGIL